ncbi:MAG TPA: 5-carboxymethyl-2-hydroxymuconate semialdehyde dehydrogenase [Thermomicrobiaceae bacterium]|nr:5-carboxymethyl-2-hydroxymuconate semialdehyde dehydrogenase [Thermomicrobiaceae bacterium]
MTATDYADLRDRLLAELPPIRSYIGGQWVEGPAGETFESLNPATNEPIATVHSVGREGAARAVQAARAAFDGGAWSRMPAAARAKRLRRIAELIRERADEISVLESADTGIPIQQIRGGQVLRAADNFDFFAELATHITGETFPVESSFLNYSVQRPVGVATLITPWNTPFMLETWKVAPCLAAGDTCILKPASWSPLSAFKLAQVIEDADLPPGTFNLAYGPGEVVGETMASDPGVNLVSFTGETTTGKRLMRAGADTLKRYSMELGGKSPVVVFADADQERALDAAVFGIFSLNGERCTAGSRLLLQRTIYDDFVGKLLERVASIRVGDPMDLATDVGPLIHRRHLERVMGYLEIGAAEGARVAAGGKRPADPALARGNYLEPTVLLDVRNDMRVAQEEIFGPVLVVLPFEDEADALRLANDVRYGLAAYLWTSDNGRALRFAPEIESGMVWVNSQNVRDLRTPFGGMKESGIGREGGHYSFEFYTETRTVHVALGEHRIPKMGAPT